VLSGWIPPDHPYEAGGEATTTDGAMHDLTSACGVSGVQANDDRGDMRGKPWMAARSWSGTAPSTPTAPR